MRTIVCLHKAGVMMAPGILFTYDALRELAGRIVGGYYGPGYVRNAWMDGNRLMADIDI